MYRFRLLSISYETTDINVRENFSLNTEQISLLLKDCKTTLGLDELLILSTCNRTELLFASENDVSDEILRLLCELKNIDISYAKTCFNLIHGQREALEYILKVSAGLKSQILGDAQIITQFKEAYRLSCECQMVGTYMHRFMQTVFSSNKKIARQTSFKKGISSVPYAAVEMCMEYLQMLHAPKIAIIGFGKMGSNVYNHLVSKGYNNLTIVNRSKEKIEKLLTKAEVCLTYFPIEDLPKVVADHDIIISALAVGQYLVQPSMFRKGIQHFKLLIDISLPRSITPEVDDISGVIRLDIDDIRTITNETMIRKNASISAVEKILIRSLGEFESWMQEHRNMEVIRNLKAALLTYKEQELSRLQQQTNSKSPGQYHVLMNAFIQKIIKNSAVTLKSLKTQEERENYSQMISRTFLR